MTRPWQGRATARGGVKVWQVSVCPVAGLAGHLVQGDASLDQSEARHPGHWPIRGPPQSQEWPASDPGPGVDISKYLF